MLVIGSVAMRYHGFDVVPHDDDYICTFEEFQGMAKGMKAMTRSCVPLDGSHFHIVTHDGHNYEFEIAWPGTSGAILLDRYGRKGTGWIDSVAAPLEVLLALKLSHRYKKNSPHFLKTMRDIQKLRAADVEVGDWLMQHFIPQREAETYVYNHPKLDVNKQEFFAGDGVQYIYDHDSIHLTQALRWDHSSMHYWPVPAYTSYMKEGSEVMASKEKFFALSEETRLHGVYEETCVLALERSQIPYGIGKPDGPTPRWSFEKALEKVCTSVTSGWFREYAWENYDKVLALYEEMGENDYVERFQTNIKYLKPFKE